MEETVQKQQEDSDRIFRMITSGDFTTYDEAESAVMMLFTTDPDTSRSGISHALKRLERHFLEVPL